MKKSLSLVLIALMLVVLGCSLDRFTGKSDDGVPTPVPDSDTNTSSTNGQTTSSETSKSGSADLSMDKFNKIQLGMSYKEVTDIMGSPGNETASSKVGSYESKSYQWKGEKFDRINVRFRNGELVYKFQSGLTGTSGDADITQAKFNEIKTGMSYEEVKKIIGSEGEMVSVTKSGNITSTSYRWKGKKFANIFTNFRDNKLSNKTQSGLN